MLDPCITLRESQWIKISRNILTVAKIDLWNKYRNKFKSWSVQCIDKRHREKKEIDILACIQCHRLPMTRIIRTSWNLDLYNILIDKERYVNADKQHKDKFKENTICMYNIEQNHKNQVKRNTCIKEPGSSIEN